MKSRPRSVLLVDDNKFWLMSVSKCLARAGWSVHSFLQAEEALENVFKHKPDSIVTDFNLPGMSGLEFISKVKEDYPELPVILVSGREISEIFQPAFKHTYPDLFFSKPVDPELLITALRSLMEVVDLPGPKGAK